MAGATVWFKKVLAIRQIRLQGGREAIQYICEAVSQTFQSRRSATRLARQRAQQMIVPLDQAREGDLIDFEVVYPVRGAAEQARINMSADVFVEIQRPPEPRRLEIYYLEVVAVTQGRGKRKTNAAGLFAYGLPDNYQSIEDFQNQVLRLACSFPPGRAVRRTINIEENHVPAYLDTVFIAVTRQRRIYSYELPYLNERPCAGVPKAVAPGPDVFFP